MASSPQQGFPILTQKEVGGEVSYNDFVRMSDALVPAVMQAIGVDTPPGSPSEGQVWTIGNPALWPDSVADGVAAANQFAQWYNGAWYYFDPVEGYKVYSIGDVGEYRFLAGVWAVA